MVNGLVKSYNVHKGWGFVAHQGKDVFITAAELKGLVVKEGDKISFITKQGEKGPYATNIKFMGGSPEKYQGEIKSFSSRSGYGFITCEAFEGKDIFFLKHDLSDSAKACARDVVKEGSYCTFKYEEGERGPTATDVWLVGAAGKNAENLFKWQGGWGGFPMQVGWGPSPMDMMMMMGMAGMGGMGGMGMGGMGMDGMGMDGGFGGKGVRKPMFEKKAGIGKGKSKGSDWSKGGGSSKGIDTSKTVWIGGIPKGTTFQDLLELGNQAGSAKWAEVFEKHGKLTGAIGFASASETKSAIPILNGATIGKSVIQADSWGS